MIENANPPGLTAGSTNDAPGWAASAGKIITFPICRVKKAAAPIAPMPGGFDVVLSRRLDALIYLIEELQDEKHRLERLIPAQGATR